MHSSRHRRLRVALPVATATATAALLAGCGTESPSGDSRAEPKAGASSTTPSQAQEEREVAGLAPRALITRPGGLSLLDAESGEVLDEVDLDGFLRLSDAGDGRHVAVSDTDVFRIYDTGISAQAHGDHAHFYESPAGMTEQSLDAPEAGHVVPHDGRTAFFSDGAGTIQVIDTDRLGDPDAEVDESSTDEPHHGVALELDGGTLLTTQGDAEHRDTVQLLDGDEVLAETDDCTGVHGEAAAAPDEDGEVVAFGCEDGPVILRDGEFHKVDLGKRYARTGTLAGHPDSPVVLTDYKTDPDAELERPTQVGLLDTRKDTLRPVELGSSYWFRSLARGPHGEALVVTYDGALRVIDPESARQVESIDVIESWREPADWQQPGPVLKVAGTRAYVTDPATKELVVVDLERREVEQRLDLPDVAGELAVVTGQADAGHEH